MRGAKAYCLVTGSLCSMRSWVNVWVNLCAALISKSARAAILARVNCLFLLENTDNTRKALSTEFTKRLDSRTLSAGADLVRDVFLFFLVSKVCVALEVEGSDICSMSCTV